MTLDKVALRRQMQARREAISGVQRAEVASALAASADSVLAAASAAQQVFVSSYCAIGSELDPKPLEAALVARGARLCLPVMIGRGVPLVFRSYAQGDQLDDRTWGIREPQASAEVVTPDILLVPLLAVDPRGYRLGYGGGFYDRTLRQLRKRHMIAAIGIAYAEQLIGEVPTTEYDERLDWILTPDCLRVALAGQGSAA